jgi:hypothetical protein
MENLTEINATQKVTFYLTELSSEITELFIEQKYLNHYESIYDDCENGDTRYKDHIQDEFNEIYERIETYLLQNQI